MKRRLIKKISSFKEIKMMQGKWGLVFGNPSRRIRPFVYQIIRQNYNPKTGDVIKTYCVQRYNSKTLDYFIEVESKEGCDYVINAQRWGWKHFSQRDCRNIVKSIITDTVK